MTHVLHAPVPSNDGVCTVVPLTARLAGRVVVPLANRIPSVTLPAVATFTVNCTAAPVALVVLQNPLPEYPDQSESIVPSQVAGEVSASYRVVAADASGKPTAAPAATTLGPVSKSAVVAELV
ncbi:hypothetical protein E1182_22850 [Micromonospora sp. KC721]|nr:hypothetical protein E1182_22850 [Micromonospora sp. KC721]